MVTGIITGRMPAAGIGDRRLDPPDAPGRSYPPQAHKAQLLLQLLRLIGSRLFIPGSAGRRPARRAWSAMRLFSARISARFPRSWAALAVGPILGAAFQHLVRAPLVYWIKPFSAVWMVDIILRPGVKGASSTRGSCGQLGLGQPLGSRKSSPVRPRWARLLPGRSRPGLRRCTGPGR